MVHPAFDRVVLGLILVNTVILGLADYSKIETDGPDAGQLRPEEVLRPDDASTLDVATQGYGVACYLLARGQRSKAVALLEKVAETPYWPSFASCAAEAELQRLLSVK